MQRDEDDIPERSPLGGVMTELAGRMNHSTKLRAANLDLLGVPVVARADGGQDCPEAAERLRLAVRTEVGRVPLPRVQGRRRGRDQGEVRQVAVAVLSGSGREPSLAFSEHVRARRRARPPHRRNAVFRRPADAPSSRRQPHRAPVARDARQSDPLRLSAEQGRSAAAGASVRGTPGPPSKPSLPKQEKAKGCCSRRSPAT